MREPPNSPYLARLRSGQPIVWTMCRRGFGTFQTSLTPSAQICGCPPARPKRSIAAPVRWPCVPSARTVTRAAMSAPGSYAPTGRPSRPSPLSPVRIPCTRPSARSSFWASVSGSTAAPAPPRAARRSRASPRAADRAGSRTRARQARRRRSARRPRSARLPDRSAGRSPPTARTAAGSPPGERRPCSRPASPDELGQLRHDRVQVADDAEIGELEDGRVGVLVDRDDRLRALHPDLVLDRARDPAGDVERRRDGLPRLTDLRGVRVPAGVDDCARGRDGASEGLRQLLDERELLRLAETAPAGDDHVRVLDRRAALLRVRLLDHLGRERVLLQVRLEGLDGAGRGPLGRIERAGPEQADARRRLPADVDDDRVAESRLLADELAPVTRDVGQLPVEPCVQTRRQGGGDVGRQDRLAEEDRVDLLVGDELGDRVDARLRQRRFQPRIVRDVARGRTVLPRLLGQPVEAGADDHARDVAVEARSLREDRQRALLQLAVVMLEEDEGADQSSLFSARKATICSAALPSSSILRVSPRGGGSFSARTSVFDPCSPALLPSRPRSASETVSCGFDFAPMIPFRDG